MAGTRTGNEALSGQARTAEFLQSPSFFLTF
jgi:hypothetical protein